MADPTIAEAISILTKVSADTANKLKSLEKEIRSSISGKGTPDRSRGSTEPRVPREIVEKADDVVVTNFGPEAEADLAAAFGRETERVLEKQKKTDPPDLKQLLMMAGLGAAMAALFEGEGFTGLVQGLQNVYRRLDRFATRAGRVLRRVGGRISRFASQVGRRASSALRRAGRAISRSVSAMRQQARRLVSRIGSKLRSVASSVRNGISRSMSRVRRIVGSISTQGIRGTFSRISSRLSSFGKSITEGMEAAKKKVADMARKVTQSAPVKATKRAASRAASFAGNLFSKAKGAVTKAKNVAISAGKSAAGVAARGARAAGRAAAATGGALKGAASKAVQYTKSKVLKPLTTAMKKVKPLKLLKGLLKSPLLAPILESFFTYKDVEELVAQEAAGEINEAELNQKVGTRLIKAVTGVIGGAAGASLGFAIGSGIPVAGNIVGAIVGGVLGDVGGRLIGGLIADKLGDKASILGERALKSKMFNHLGQPVIGEPLAQIDDGIIFSQDGRVLAQANPSDTIYAMKEGGPLLTTLASGFESNGKILINLHEMHTEHMTTQIELDEERNSLLLELGKLLYASLDLDSKGGGTLSPSMLKFAGNSIADIRSFY